MKNIYKGDTHWGHLVEAMYEAYPEITVSHVRELVKGMEWNWISRTGKISEAGIQYIIMMEKDEVIQEYINKLKQ